MMLVLRSQVSRCYNCCISGRGQWLVTLKICIITTPGQHQSGDTEALLREAWVMGVSSFFWALLYCRNYLCVSVSNEDYISGKKLSIPEMFCAPLCWLDTYDGDCSVGVMGASPPCQLASSELWAAIMWAVWPDWPVHALMPLMATFCPLSSPWNANTSEIPTHISVGSAPWCLWLLMQIKSRSPPPQ